MWGRMGLKVKIESIENPRKESEDHYYNPSHSGLLDLGLTPHYLTDDVLSALIEKVLKYKDRINTDIIYKGVKW